MSRLAQLYHVFAKDVRQERWVMLAYLVVAGAACVNAVLPNGPTRGFAAMISIVVLSLLVVATVVQSDSPARADAFWASRPFSPGAVLGAKGAFTLLLVVALPVVGEVMGLRANGVASSAFPRMLAFSTAMYVEILLMGALIAAVTPNLPSFIITVALAVIVPGFAANLGTDSLSDRFGRHGPAIMMMAVVVGIATLVVVYRRRDARRGLAVLAVGCAAAIMIAFQLTPPAIALNTDVSVSGPPIALRVTSAKPFAVANTVLSVALPIDSTDGLRRVLDLPTADVHLADGRSFSVSLGGDVDLSIPMPRQLHNAIWFGDHPRSVGELSIPLDSNQHAWIAKSHIANVVLTGYLFQLTPDVLGPEPVVPGMAFRAHGSVYRVTRFAHGRYSAVFDLARTTIEPAASSALPWTLNTSMDVASKIAPELVFVSSHVPERPPFNSGSGNSSSSSSGAVLLPGPENVATGSEHRERTANSALAMTPADSEWFANARIALVTWKARGDAHQFTATITAP